MDAFYMPKRDAETFVLEVRNGHGSHRVLRGAEYLKAHIQGAPEKDRALLMAYATLHSGERYLRPALRRKLDKKLRNIELGVQTAGEYHARLFADARASKPKEKRSKKMPSLENQLADALKPLRQALGLGLAQPSKHSYRITEDALAATANPDLQQKLRSLVTHGDFSDVDLQELQKSLKSTYPQDAKAVVAAVKATASREHLSAVSLDTQDDKLRVTIVNAEGQRLTMPESKLRILMTSPNNMVRLHTYLRESRRDRDPNFVFSTMTRGAVFGTLCIARCELAVVCLDEEDPKNQYERARFVLDLDYLCCLYLVLVRIREDRERHERYLEQADAAANVGHFTGASSPFTLEGE